jgi:hypothetical protein
MKKEKGIDDIFRHSLQDPVNEPEFAEHGWNDLENMLDKSDKGGRIAWLPYLSAAAAVVLIAFCWWIFKPVTNSTQNQSGVVKIKPVTGDSKAGDTALGQKEIVKSQVKPINGNTILKHEVQREDIAQRAVTKQYTAGISNKNKASVSNGLTTPDKPEKNKAPEYTADLSIKTSDLITAANPAFNLVPSADYHLPVSGSSAIASPQIMRPLAASKPDIKKTSTLSSRPQFALTVFGSPELNGVGSFQSASKGTNVGLLFTVGVKKFTLSTGASYTLKPYSLPYSQYPSAYTYKNTPETVTADCRMLDIPINIGYQIYNKSSNKITLGTGISSYIMMHESYTYDYAANAKKVYGPSYYQVEGKGKYLFSIMNLQATYERQINSKFGLSVQPYFKVPLSEIGYSQVKVQTFGVALGINWNINSLTKPK